MSTLPDDALEQRLARLERMVEELHRRLPPLRGEAEEWPRPPVGTEAARTVPLTSGDFGGWGTRGPRA
ncbi:MAG TPA: hypothetical protein VEY93_10255, partial [Longimicrobium sp.]|nr:hypothetical protein [Longimicrobium sp.]